MATTSKAVKTSCKNTKVRSASGTCVSERPTMKKGGSTKSFPDLNKDGKVTKADILVGRKIIPKAQKGAIVDYTKTFKPVNKRQQIPSFDIPKKDVNIPVVNSDWNSKSNNSELSQFKKKIEKKQMGGASKSCGYAKAQRKNKRSASMSKVGPVVGKVLGTIATIGAGAIGAMKGKKMLEEQKTGGTTHPGFKAVQSSIAAKQGISKQAAGAILASSARKASAKAKAANPRLKRVK